MCGIAGYIDLRHGVTQEVIRKMTNAIEHRGPDGEGQWIDQKFPIALGHRRLSIIDLSDSGAQPMHHSSGRYHIVFNGEIYNYIELKSKYLRDKRFNSDTDTEVLLNLFELKGPQMLAELEGMYAFTIWDSLKQELFVARDRFGEKPFFYFQDSQAFYFASEMKALWAGGVQKSMDSNRIEQFLGTAPVTNNPSSFTYYSGIQQLPNAHYGIWSKEKGLQIHSYYSIRFGQVDLDDVEATAEFRRLFIESISRRLRSDVKVGSSLSGGLDSSCVVAVINGLKAEDQMQEVFSAKFPGFERDESKYIDMVVAHLKDVQDHFTTPNENELQEDLEQIVYHQEEPFGSSSIFAQWKVMKLARENGTTVMLDGQGADELLAGYIPYYTQYANQLLFQNPRKLRSELHQYNKLRNNTLEDPRKKETARMKLGRYKANLLGKEKPLSSTYLKERLQSDLFGGSLIDLLRYADRNAMAHGIETRLPFLDHNLVDFTFGLSDELLLRKGWTKWILRKSFENTLPKSIIWRIDKVGYEPPQKKWLESGWVKERVFDSEKILGVTLSNSSKPYNYTADSRWKMLMLSYFVK